MLHYVAEDWLTSSTDAAGENECLERNSTTLLIGPPGSGKTTIAFQFLFNHFRLPNSSLSSSRTQKKPLADPVLPGATQPSGKEPVKPVFVSFDLTESTFKELLNAAWNRYWRPPLPGEQPQAPEEKIASLILRQAHTDPNLVVAQLRECVHQKPPRMVIDGLSEWISTFSPSEGALILEALFTSVREEATDYDLPLFIVFEADPRNPRVVPYSYGIPADNIIVLEKIHLPNGSRQLIYVAKASRQPHDRSPREVVFKERGPLSIVAGFDDLSGLMGNGPRPAEVLLQLLEENEAEQRWNRWLLRRLRGLRPLDYRLLSFSRSDMGRTMESSSQDEWLSPSDLKIMSVDEWWLPQPPSDEEQSPRLLELSGLWKSYHRDNPQTSWTDFWRFERVKCDPKWQSGRVPKASAIQSTNSQSSPEGTEREGRKIFAVPAYMDFGLFCINVEMLQACPPGFLNKLQSKLEPNSEQSKGTAAGKLSEEEIKIQARIFDLRERLISRRTRNKKTQSASEPRSDEEAPLFRSLDQDLGFDGARQLKKFWGALLATLPRSWTPNDWDPSSSEDQPEFANESNKPKETTKGCPDNLLDLGLQLKGGGQDPGPNGAGAAPKVYLFAFENTPGNCVCVWFELAWAFGAPEDFLNENAKQNAKAERNEAAIRALVWLQEMVIRELMPARATIHEARSALFSRQWYSTLRQLSLEDADSLPLLALPFWPVGKHDLNTLREMFKEVVVRFLRTLKLIHKYFSRRLPPGIESIGKDIESMGEDIQFFEGTYPNMATGSEWEAAQISVWMERLFAATNTVGSLLKHKFALVPPDHQEAASHDVFRPKYLDFLENYQTHLLRLRLLTSCITASGMKDKTKRRHPPQTLDEVIQEWVKSPSAPPPAVSIESVRDFQPWNPVLTGHGCSGSWLYAVQRRSRSLTLTHELLAELTSREAAEQRAALGAGLPSRIDFYASSGDRPVPSAEHLTWRNLVRFAGARARRRSAVLGNGPKSADLHEWIATHIQILLQAADAERPLSARPDGLVKARQRAYERAKHFVEEATLRRANCDSKS